LKKVIQELLKHWQNCSPSPKGRLKLTPPRNSFIFSKFEIMSELLTKPETMVDIYRLLPEGTPVQVINNHLYMSPAPNVPHFRIVSSLSDQFRRIVRESGLGEVFFAPVDVYLGDKNAIQPDVFYISNENAHIIKEDAVYGSPDLIVEVLSPGNKKADLVKKKAIYEEFGIKEYFIVNPADRSVITYYLENKTYIEQKLQKGKLISKLLNAEIAF
jgi:Uma2 family endonuclease